MKNIIKSISVFVTVIAVVFCFLATASAENIYANIESAFTKIDIPDGFTVTSANVYTESKLVYEANAETEDANKTLCITSEKNEKSQDVFNFKYLSKNEIDKELTDLKSGTSDLTGKTFSNVTNASFKEKEDYIEFYLYNSEIIDNSTINNAVTYTVINGELITITYSSKSGAFTAEEKEIFNNISESITVDKLRSKPQSIDIGKILSTVFTIIIFVFLVITAILVVYYLKNKNTRNKSSSKLADKYYDELKSEGLMDENLQTSVKNKKTKKSPSNLSKNGISSAMNNWRQPSLIEDEWEDMDIEKMFVVPNKIESDKLRPLDDGYGPLTNGPTEFIHGDSSPQTYISETMIEDYNKTDAESTDEDIEKAPKMSRSDSAKRFAKMFIGSNVEHKEFDDMLSDEYKETQSTLSNTSSDEIKNSRSSRRSSDKRKKTGTAKAKSGNTRSRRRQSQIINDFELDSYWDKYR